MSNICPLSMENTHNNVEFGVLQKTSKHSLISIFFYIGKVDFLLHREGRLRPSIKDFAAKAVVGVHTFIAHSGDNWQTLTNVMAKKGTMAAATLELPSPDVRRWNLKPTVPVSLMSGI